MVEAIKAYPGAPTFSWLIASRVTNKYEDSDAFITVFGRKGSGKSTASLALCESIAENISYIRGKNEDPKEFFNVDHVVTVTKEGAIKLLTSGILKKRNSVILLDDVSIQWNSRSFQTWVNKALNDILTIARVFSCVIIANCVQKSHLDKVARELTDFQIQMVSKSTITKQSIFKAYYYEIGNDGTEYKRFLTWKGKRIKYWLCGKPSIALETEYKRIRMENTGDHIEQSYAKFQERTNPQPKTDGRIKDYANMPIVVENRERVTAMLKAGERVEAIVRATGLTRYWVQRIQSLNL